MAAEFGFLIMFPVVRRVKYYQICILAYHPIYATSTVAATEVGIIRLFSFLKSLAVLANSIEKLEMTFQLICFYSYADRMANELHHQTGSHRHTCSRK
jgi:hypothetical protein